MTAPATLNGLPPIPRSTAKIREQLNDLANVKKLATAYGAPDFASQVGMQSTLDHERELLAELRAAELLESDNAAEILFDGDPVCDHSIQAAFLGSMLSKRLCFSTASGPKEPKNKGPQKGCRHKSLQGKE